MRQSDEHPKAREDIPDTVWNIQVQLGDPALPEGIGFGENPSFDELAEAIDRKSTRLNSSHGSISYAVFCL